MCARLGATLDLLELGSSPAIFWAMSPAVAVQMIGLGFFVAGLRQLVDRPRPIRHTHEAAAQHRRIRQFFEPVLHQTLPARAGRNKVIGNARMLFRPRQRLLLFSRRARRKLPGNRDAVLTCQRSQNNPAAQRHLLRCAVRALPLPRRRCSAGNDLIGKRTLGMERMHSKPHLLRFVTDGARH
jgi:hypothetical protein